MIAIFDEDGGGDVDFQEFVSGLSAFSSKGNKEDKLKFAFKVYDIDRDGYISNGELFIVLKMMVGSNLKDQQLQQIVDKTIMEADLDKDGKISFEEFTKMVENTDVSMSMTLGKSRAFEFTSNERPFLDAQGADYICLFRRFLLNAYICERVGVRSNEFTTLHDRLGSHEKHLALLFHTCPIREYFATVLVRAELV